MKFTLAIVLISFSLTGFARQYIQCSNISSSDPFYTVINLVDENHGTLFATAGVETDENILLEIKKNSETETTVMFQTLEGSNAPATLEILKKDIGVNSRNLNIQLSFSGVQLELGCFSAIYND